MRNHSLLELAAIGVVLGLNGIGWANSVEGVNAPVVVDYRGVTTEDFESGSLKLSDVSEGVLVGFFRTSIGGRILIIWPMADSRGRIRSICGNGCRM
jgi:hypothetical protein